MNIKISLNKFIGKRETGELYPIDFDDNGGISCPETCIRSFFAIQSNQDKSYSGLITFPDFDDTLWE